VEIDNVCVSTGRGGESQDSWILAYYIMNANHSFCLAGYYGESIIVEIDNIHISIILV
jgi:hypothetical protein